MAGFQGAAIIVQESLAAATQETVIQLIAATNHPVKVIGFGVFFTGTSVTAAPVLVVLQRQSTAGTASALTVVKLNDSLAESLVTTAQQDFTGAEPTSGDIVDAVEVHPQGGYEVKYPLGQEIIVGGSDRIGLRCTAPATVTVTAKIFFEE